VKVLLLLKGGASVQAKELFPSVLTDFFATSPKFTTWFPTACASYSNFNLLEQNQYYVLTL